MPPRLPRLLPRLLPLLLWTPAIIFVNTHVASLHLVRGRSMSPTLSPNSPISHDLILVNRWSATSALRRGQLILFRSPTDPERVAIKRVIGIEGDVVRPRSIGEVGEWMGVEGVRVPVGQIWVEGDEGVHSLDSNVYGAIPVGCVTAKVLAVVWPLARAGWAGESEKEGRRGALLKRGGQETTIERERNGPAVAGGVP